MQHDGARAVWAGERTMSRRHAAISLTQGEGMNIIKRLVAVAAIAILTALAAAAAAPASRLRISSQTFRISWAPFTVQGLLIGHITKAISANAGCTGGKLYMLNGTERLNGRVVANTLPWHFQYEGFFGTLPNITGVDTAIVGASFLIEIAGINCLYQSTNEEPWFGIFELGVGGRITGFRNDETAPIPPFAGECVGEAFPSNTGGVQVLGITTAISITLI